MARYIKSDAVHHGRNFDRGAFKDDRQVRCARCGWICQLDRDSRHPEGSLAGWGIKFDETTGTAQAEYDDASFDYNTPIWYDGLPLADYTRDDPVVIGGCPQCGTYLYNK